MRPRVARLEPERPLRNRRYRWTDKRSPPNKARGIFLERPPRRTSSLGARPHVVEKSRGNGTTHEKEVRRLSQKVGTDPGSPPPQDAGPPLPGLFATT